MGLRGLDLLAKATGDVLAQQTAQRQAMLRSEMERKYKERMVQEDRLFRAGENRKARETTKELAGDRENALLKREQIGIDAGKYDKTGKYSFWSKLKLDPKYKAGLGVAESNIKELSDIVSSPSAMWFTPEQRAVYNDQIKFYRGIQNEIIKMKLPNIWKKVRGDKPETTPPPLKKDNDPFAEFGGQRKK